MDLLPYPKEPNMLIDEEKYQEEEEEQKHVYCFERMIHGNKITRCKLSKDGNVMYTSGMDGKLNAWDITTPENGYLLKCEFKHRFKMKDNPSMQEPMLMMPVISDFSIDDKEERIYSSSMDGKIRIFNMKRGGDPIREIQTKSPLTAITIYEQQRIIFAGSKDGRIYAWNYDENDVMKLHKEYHKIGKHHSNSGVTAYSKFIIHQLAIYQDTLISLSEDGIIKQYNIQTAENTKITYVHPLVQLHISKENIIFVQNGQSTIALKHYNESHSIQACKQVLKMENTTRYGFACDERIFIAWNQREGNMELYDVDTQRLIRKRFIKNGIFIHQIQTQQLSNNRIRIFYATNRHVQFLDMDLHHADDQKYHIALAHLYTLYVDEMEALKHMHFKYQHIAQILQTLHADGIIQPHQSLDVNVAMATEHLLTLPTSPDSKKETSIGYSKSVVESPDYTINPTARKERLRDFYLALAGMRKKKPTTATLCLSPHKDDEVNTSERRFVRAIQQLSFSLNDTLAIKTPQDDVVNPYELFLSISESLMMTCLKPSSPRHAFYVAPTFAPSKGMLDNLYALGALFGLALVFQLPLSTLLSSLSPVLFSHVLHHAINSSATEMIAPSSTQPLIAFLPPTPIEHFVRGFHTIVPLNMLQQHFYHGIELHLALLPSNPTVPSDVPYFFPLSQWKNNCIYDGTLHPLSPQVEWFWQSMEKIYDNPSSREKLAFIYHKLTHACEPYRAFTLITTSHLVKPSSNWTNQQQHARAAALVDPNVIFLPSHIDTAEDMYTTLLQFLRSVI